MGGISRSDRVQGTSGVALLWSLAPAASSAAHNALRGQPQMFRISAQTIQVKFTTDQRGRRNGVRVAIGQHGATRKVTPNGRHGRDFKYVARVKVDQPLAGRQEVHRALHVR